MSRCTVSCSSQLKFCIIRYVPRCPWLCDAVPHPKTLAGGGGSVQCTLGWGSAGGSRFYSRGSYRPVVTSRGGMYFPSSDVVRNLTNFGSRLEKDVR